MSMLNKLLDGLEDMKEGEIVTRKWKGNKVVEETRTKTDWKPNVADLDIVLVGCECGNQYDIPRDVLMYLNDNNSFCGQCGKSGLNSVIADPSPNRREA